MLAGCARRAGRLFAPLQDACRLQPLSARSKTWTPHPASYCSSPSAATPTCPRTFERALAIDPIPAALLYRGQVLWSRRRTPRRVNHGTFLREPPGEDGPRVSLSPSSSRLTVFPPRLRRTITVLGGSWDRTRPRKEGGQHGSLCRPHGDLPPTGLRGRAPRRCGDILLAGAHLLLTNVRPCGSHSRSWRSIACVPHASSTAPATGSRPARLMRGSEID